MLDINDLDDAHGDQGIEVNITASQIDNALSDIDLVADAINEMKLYLDDLNARGNQAYNFLHSTNSDDLAHELQEVGRAFVKHCLIKEHIKQG